MSGVCNLATVAHRNGTVDLRQNTRKTGSSKNNARVALLCNVPLLVPNLCSRLKHTKDKVVTICIFYGMAVATFATGGQVKYGKSFGIFRTDRLIMLIHVAFSNISD